MENKREEDLKSINCFPWNSEWECAEGGAEVRRVDDGEIITVGVLLTLFSIFSNNWTAFRNFLLRLSPEGINLVSVQKVKRIVSKLSQKQLHIRKKGSKGTTVMGDFLRKPYLDKLFCFDVSPPSLSDREIGRLTTQLESCRIKESELYSEIASMKMELADLRCNYAKAKVDLKCTQVHCWIY